ncbi:mitochondrial 54S ribosomal protein uL24m [Arthrobotrys flagrans]|uniref:KOW domain-containing protein n=1 Tax=Arthrobotrys flagrans TaxID=97331 RepID=A0A437ADT9_ARTFL|nr:hypothetical protein DFL_000267 [Arthrobotrys flagrans]
MERVIRRTILAKAAAARRYARETQQKLAYKRMKRAQYDAMLREHNRFVAKIRSELVEDVKMGPLAPVRGKDAKDRIARDLPSADAMRLPEVVEPRKFFNVAVGDRVVILNGKDRNKVGLVKEVDPDTDSVKVQGLNVYPVRTPEYFEGLDGGESPGMDQECSISYTDVRLVHPIEDPKTGVLRDAIVKKVRISNVRKDAQGKRTWTRWVAFSQTEIPWPKKTEPEYEDQQCDTKRMDAEERTYVPTLLKPPIPDGVIDELRGKFSKFRDRHDREYIEKKMREDEEEKARKKARVVTPLMDINRKIRREKIEKGKTQKLTSNILEQLGRTMAQSATPFMKERPNRVKILEEIERQEGAGFGFRPALGQLPARNLEGPPTTSQAAPPS